ncbi:MAG TPA: DinB family protein, partial [Acidobacteriaceae bacterium]
LTYAEGKQLDTDQLAALKTELDPASALDPRIEFREALQRSTERIRAISPNEFATPRGVGRKQLPTTVGGLLVHCADHTQRHTGQIVTTAKIVAAS